MKRIYVAGPYTHGDVAVNVRTAIIAGLELIGLGYAPYVPHLMHFVHMMLPQPYETWMAVDLAWVRQCDAMLRLSGTSSGADREEALARQIGIPVYSSVKDILRDPVLGWRKKDEHSRPRD
ncbi:DUF7768 domain-containing protein [Nitrospira sp. Nam74]